MHLSCINLSKLLAAYSSASKSQCYVALEIKEKKKNREEKRHSYVEKNKEMVPKSSRPCLEDENWSSEGQLCSNDRNRPSAEMKHKTKKSPAARETTARVKKQTGSFRDLRDHKTGKRSCWLRNLDLMVWVRFDLEKSWRSCCPPFFPSLSWSAPVDHSLFMYCWLRGACAIAVHASYKAWPRKALAHAF